MQNKLEKVNWGIIGAGDVCEIKSGPAFQMAKGSDLVAVMRRNAGKAADFADRHHVPKWYDDADKLINDPDINAIYIATPPHVHETYTIKASEAGKAVYVEKPMARTYKECRNMVEACKYNEVPLFVAFYRRALPNILKIQELVHSGVIGNIRFVDIKLIKPILPDIVGASGQKDNWRIIPEIAGGGYFYDLASHQLDALDFIFGPIREARGYAINQAGQYSVEDLVTGHFTFDQGIIGQGTWCFNSSLDSEMELTTIIGSKGKITFPFFGDHHVSLHLDGEPRHVMRFDISPNIQLPLIQSIVDELRGVGKCPSTGESGARTGRVLDEICQRIDLVKT